MSNKSNFSKIVLGFTIICLPLISSATIPVSQIKGLDELFKPQYKIYSPLTGLLQHKTFVRQAFPKTNAPESYIEKLLSILFVKISDDEIVPSHIAKNPAAHLSGQVIAKIFIELEKAKAFKYDSGALSIRLNDNLKQLILSDPRYQEEMDRAKKNSEILKSNYAEFSKNFALDQAAALKAEEFKVKFYDPISIRLKKLNSEAKKEAFRKKEKVEPTPEMVQLEASRLPIYKQYQDMIAAISSKGGVSKSIKLKKEYDLKHDLENNDVMSQLYQTSLDDFVKILVGTFIRYDLEMYTPTAEQYPNAGISSLLSYMWMKYMDKKDLSGYLEVLSAAGWLDKELWSKVDSRFYENNYKQENYLNLMSTYYNIWFNKSKWVSENVTDALVMSSDFSGTSKVPEYVPFSYSSWARYHLSYPDCVENAIHNVFLLISFNEKTETFDYQILEFLKENYYPKLNQKVIDYFKTYPSASDNNTDQAKRDWIDLVSGLNQDPNAPADQKITYNSERTQKEICGPYVNVVKTTNNLFGVSDLAEDQMSDIFAHAYHAAHVLNQSKPAYAVVYSNINQSGNISGTADFGVGKRRFQLNSYGGHVTFNLLPSDIDQVSKEVTNIFTEKAQQEYTDKVKAFRYRAAQVYLMGSKVHQN